MGRGRKPLPTKIKAKKGTLEKSRVLKDEMQGKELTTIPAAPDWLTKTGKEEWFRTASSLAEIGMLSNLDLTVLAAYCNQMAVHIETEKWLRANERVLFFNHDDGTLKYSQVVPYQKISENALSMAMKIAVEFGFTPSSRTKISMNQVKEENDPFEDLTKTR